LLRFLYKNCIINLNISDPRFESIEKGEIKMGKIMMTAKYPPHKLNELVKTYMRTDKPAYPDYLKKVEHWAAQITGEKQKTYAVYEFPDDKIYESMTALTKRFNFYASIEGYIFKMELLVDAEAAIQEFFKK
jgi:hypothetical protein